MAYRGDDLDLRTPQGPSSPVAYGADGDDGAVAGSRARSRAAGNGTGNGPATHGNGRSRSPALYVDDALLNVCNHAYDLASANGAREVMIEHLVHAMTRVPEAAQVLENRGVHVMALRRESAAIIANDLPISSADSGRPVRASSDFDAVMHLAAANARLRGDRPTAVRDLLFVLMNYDREASGIDLLRRHWASWHQTDADTAERGPARTPLPPREPSREMPYREAQLREARLAEPRPAVYYEPAPAPQVERYQPAMPPRDPYVDGRLEQLVVSLHEAVAALRNENHGLRAALGDRLHRLEKLVEQPRHDGGTAALEAALIARLQRLEKLQEAALGQRVSFAPLEAAMAERFQRLEKAFETTRLEAGKLPVGIQDRLAGVERAVENRLAEAARSWGLMGERMQRLEKSIEGVTHAMPAGLVDRMQGMERAFEAKIGEATRSWGNLGERLAGIERGLSTQRAELAHLQSGDEKLQTLVNSRYEAIERGIEAWREEMDTNPGQMPTGLIDRLTGTERALGALREDMTRLTKLHEGEMVDLCGSVARLGSTQQTLATTLDQWRQDLGGNLGIVLTRLEAMETSSLRPVELLESLEKRIQGLGTQSLGVQPAATTTGGYGGGTYGGGYGSTQSTTGVGGQTVSAAIPGASVRIPQRKRGFWRWLFGLG